MREWLPEDDLVFIVLDAVATLDLGGFRRKYRADGHGRAALDPEMMVALLLYAYCQGERSSRVIEKRCVRDVTYRVIAGGLHPDHATIAGSGPGTEGAGPAEPGRDQAGRQRRAEGEPDAAGIEKILAEAAAAEDAREGGSPQSAARSPGRTAAALR